MTENEPGKSINIKGLIIPCRWDEDGNAKEALLAGFDERNYTILMDKANGCLLDLLYKEVEISGNLVKIKDSDTIKVKKYKITKNL